MDSNQIRPGPNTLIVETPMGFAVGAPSNRGSFRHPFRGVLSKGGIRFSKGIVMGLFPHEPTIGRVPISGDDQNAAPVLRLEASVLASGSFESWACVEVTPNADGTDDAKTLVEVVHRSAPNFTTGPTGRHPLCLIIWKNGNPVRLFDIAYFNLRYFRTTPTAGHGLPRHLFF